MTCTTTPAPVGIGPVRVVVWDLDGALPDLDGTARTASGVRYARARVLLRLAGRPVAQVDVDLPPEGLDALDLVDLARHAVAGCPDPDPPVALAELPAVSVVIPTRDRPEALAAALATVLAGDHPRVEVIVVDNAPSTDLTARLVQSHPDPRVRYVHEPRPGISAARNAGVAAARHDLVAFTDDDVHVDASWASSLAAVFVRHPEAGAVTGLVIPAVLDTPAQIRFELAGGFGKGLVARSYTASRTAVDPLFYPYSAGSFGSGNNMAFRREVLAGLGGFDEALGVGTPSRGGEDLDVLLALVLAGGVVRYEPAALIRHVHRADHEGLRRQMVGYGSGLTAMLTKRMLAGPSAAAGVLRAVPQGVWFLIDPTSRRNSGRQDDYPSDLTRAELSGMLRGPVWYLRGRWRARRPPGGERRWPRSPGTGA